MTSPTPEPELPEAVERAIGEMETLGIPLAMIQPIRSSRRNWPRTTHHDCCAKPSSPRSNRSGRCENEPNGCGISHLSVIVGRTRR